PPSAGTTTVDSPVCMASHGIETYGPVQVRLTFQGHRIVDAVALQTPDHAARSRQINARAVPILRQEVLDAQSAQIDTVTGATATSAAYAQCVQAILDQAWK
ncbi:MAG TPA: FMN-binding protein, partial [Acidimicrobiia bacterium]